MAKSNVKNLRKDVLLSTRDIKRFFKISKFQLEKASPKLKLKSIRVNNDSYYVLSDILNLLSELVNKQSEK